MKFIQLSLIIGFFLSSCASEPKSELDRLYNAFESEQKPETYQPLIKEAIAVINDEESSDDERKNAMMTGLKASKKMNNTSQAVGFLNTYLREYPDSEDRGEKLYELGVLLSDAGMQEAGVTVLQGFVDNYPDHPNVEDARKLIPENAPTPEERLQGLGATMFESDKGQLNKKAARSFVDVCEAYALTHPGDDRSADYLHKAAETARAMRTIPKALSLYDWILEEYPDHKKAPQALFLKAFTYDNNLGDVENARKHYQEFLERYPDDDFADDTQFLLENLGKSDEEILEALTKKNQDK